MADENKKEKSNSLSEGEQREVVKVGISLDENFTTTIRTMSNQNGERDRRLKQLIEAMSEEEQLVCASFMRTSVITAEHSRRTLQLEECINDLRKMVKGWMK